ncbi:MAG: hypothetical protein OET44_12940, partial [Gammaproteobacteria bacterium]|nr:hypothetical protein [Gammaproteobacteria bacterium]
MWVNNFAAAPLSSLVPVSILLLGFGMKTIVITVVLFAVWIIALDNYAAVLQRVTYCFQHSSSIDYAATHFLEMSAGRVDRGPALA